MAVKGVGDTLLVDGDFARRVAHRARTMVTERYDWPMIAARTASVYAAAVAGRAGRGTPAAGPDTPRPRIVVPEGNLFAQVGAA